MDPSKIIYLPTGCHISFNNNNDKKHLYLNNVCTYRKMITEEEFSKMNDDEQFNVIEKIRKENDYLKIIIENLKLRIELNNLGYIEDLT